MNQVNSVALVVHSQKPPQTCCKVPILPACCNLSRSCQKLDQVATSLLSFADLLNLLKQLAVSLWVTSFGNQ